MDDLQTIRTFVPVYADYGDEATRRLTDEQVRAWVGEALSRLRERVVPLDTADSDQLEALLMTCGFTDQALMRTLDHITIADAQRIRLHAADRALFDLGNRADAVDAADAVKPFLDEVRAGFAARSTVIEAIHGEHPTH